MLSCGDTASAVRKLSFLLVATSEAIAADGSPLLRVVLKTRKEDKWIIKGDVGDEAVNVQAVVTQPLTYGGVLALLEPGEHRKQWTVEATVDDELIKIWPGSDPPDGEMTETRIVDLYL